MTAAPIEYYAKGLCCIGTVNKISVFVDASLVGFSILRGKLLYLQYKYPTVIDLTTGRVVSSKYLEFKRVLEPSCALIAYNGAVYILGEKHGA